MNLGIADGAELAKRIVDGDIEGYSPLRYREGAAAIKVTERGRKMVAGMNWRRRTAFCALLASANAIEPIKRRLGRFLVEF